MSTLVEDLLPLAYELRGLSGEFGMNLHSVELVSSSWTGTHTGDGTRSDYYFQLLEGGQNPGVRWLNDEELTMAGLSAGAIEVSPLTPDHEGLERLAELRGDNMVVKDTRRLLITGPKHPTGALYRITELQAHDPLRYILKASPVEAQT